MLGPPPPQEEHDNGLSSRQYIAVIVVLTLTLITLAYLDISVGKGYVASAASAAAAVLGSAFRFLWSAAPYLVVGYVAIEQFRISHNLSILRRGIENLQGKQFTEY